MGIYVQHTADDYFLKENVGEEHNKSFSVDFHDFGFHSFLVFDFKHFLNQKLYWLDDYNVTVWLVSELVGEMLKGFPLIVIKSLWEKINCNVNFFLIQNNLNKTIVTYLWST